MERRCWPAGGDPLMDAYHDREWGVPCHDERRHFEYLVLDAFQAGLSWRCVLHKREGFRKAFAGFDPDRVARFGARDVRRLLADDGIIRNRQKIDAAIRNARAFLELARGPGGFDRHIWSFTGGRTIRNRWTALRQLPARTAESDAMSADLKARGFGFVGSTICYAYMQAAGMVNDHLVGCARWKAVATSPRRGRGSTRSG
jgi:DNA-3-methyladenine glycosylase I